MYALYFALSCLNNSVLTCAPVQQPKIYSSYALCIADGTAWIKTFPVLQRTGHNYICWPV